MTRSRMTAALYLLVENAEILVERDRDLSGLAGVECEHVTVGIDL